MNSPIISYIPFIFIGAIILFAVIFVPAVYRYTLRKRREAAGMLPDLCQKLGLTPSGNGAEGYYKGYYVYFQMSITANIPKVADAYRKRDASSTLVSK